ncbi:hypothetical protein PO124_31850 [Bacillus licheniformis]|nr:hypothetical protein [Bacillus licheniformis]
MPYLIAKADTYDPQNSWSISLNRTQINTSGLNLSSPGTWWNTTNETNSAYLSGLKAGLLPINILVQNLLRLRNLKPDPEQRKTAGQRPKQQR